MGFTGPDDRNEKPVALQGTIDSFALADVLRLLANSSKTGRLVVNGERGSVSLWLATGDLVGGQTSADPTAADIVDICFDVLRFESGSFIFEAGASCQNPQPPTPVGAVLEQAEAFLIEWRDIVSVVPSMLSWVSLADALPHPEVVVDQACWTSIIAVGSGSTVSRIAEELRLGELPACRLVRALVHAGFVEVGEPVESDEVADALASQAEIFTPSVPSPATEEDQDDPFGEFDPFGSSKESLDDQDGIELPSLTISGLSDDPFAPASFPAPYVPDEETDSPSSDSDSDITRGLSMLSPQAAQAVAAADSSEGGSEESGDDDDGRDHVIRFLGSV
jgi:hypothetical protein